MNKPDKTLQNLVDVISCGSGTPVGITITVHGTVLTGTLISDGEYATNVAAQIRKFHNFTDREQEGYDLLFNHLSERSEARREQFAAAVAANDPEADVEPGDFLHLRDGYTLTGDHLPKGDGAYWRVRLADVSAWALVSMGDR